MIASLLAAMFLTPMVAMADLTIGEIQDLKNQASILKNQSAVNDLKKKLELDAKPPKTEAQIKAESAPPPPPVEKTMLAANIPPPPEFCTGYKVMIIRGSDDDKTALIKGRDGSEIFVKKDAVLSDGCKIEKISDQSISVRTPDKDKKVKGKIVPGKLLTVVMGADQSNKRQFGAEPDNSTGAINNGMRIPKMPPMPPMMNQNQPNVNNPYAGY